MHRTEKKRVFMLKGNLDWEMIRASEFLQKVIEYGDRKVHLNKVYRLPFLHFVNCTRRNCKVDLKYMHKIIELCSYFVIQSDYFDRFIPKVTTNQAYQQRSVIHKLLTEGFPQIAKRICLESGLPLKWCQDERITYQKFKQQFRNYERFVIWFYKHQLPGCSCIRCFDQHTKNLDELYRSKKKRLSKLLNLQITRE